MYSILQVEGPGTTFRSIILIILNLNYRGEVPRKYYGYEEQMNDNAMKR